jgi:transposase
VVTKRRLPAGARAAAEEAPRRRQARLVAGDRRRLAGGRKKGGAQVARTLRGRPGSRFHLVVDAGGLPLELLLSAGNENEQRYLLPLLDLLAERKIEPAELHADRGYYSKRHEQELAARGIRSRISRPRRRGEPIPADAKTWVAWRGKKRRLKTLDSKAGERWPIERTNAWLKAFRRIETRRDRKAENYRAFCQLGMTIILLRALLR